MGTIEISKWYEEQKKLGLTTKQIISKFNKLVKSLKNLENGTKNYVN
jgi:hypothetical protein